MRVAEEVQKSFSQTTFTNRRKLPSMAKDRAVKRGKGKKSSPIQFLHSLGPFPNRLRESSWPRRICGSCLSFPTSKARQTLGGA